MKINLLAWILPPLMLMAGGCTAAAGGGSSASLQRELDSLKSDVAAMREANRLADMRGGSSDSSAEINRLRGDFQRLSDNVGNLNSRLDRLEQQVGLKAGSGQAAGYQALNEIETAPPAGRPEPVSPSSAAPLPPAPADPYENGKELFNNKDYRAAIAQFKSYLADEPKGRNADSAQYYIGESLFAERQYEEAILEYQKVVQGFPKSRQVPPSILKQGQSFEYIGDKDGAKLLYQKVIRDFPANWTAEVAKKRLSGLSEG
ncbi:MAG: tol-pal system protein YbgF [Candidatus Adiutrix sp.]|jgi:tol-pal system protein YbgF|nr:tol-pal system protein YbgF [Candidatus Adiutrix sp.]